MNTQAQNLKQRILQMAAALHENFNAHNATILNAACRELLALTGEVFSAGAFVKVI